jgi:hypothetical protein
MLIPKEKAIAILLRTASKDFHPKDAIEACIEAGISKNIVIELVKDLEAFHLELGA